MKKVKKKHLSIPYYKLRFAHILKISIFFATQLHDL